MEEKTIATQGSATRIVIVIPALNESKAVGKLLDSIKEVMQSYEHKILVVDGHSTDGTDVIAKNRGAEVIYQKGKGYGNALKTGFLYAKKQLNGKILVMMDADLTYDPNDIPKLITPILENKADMIVGNRFAGMKKGAMSLVNRVGNRLLSLFAKLAFGLNVYDSQSGMRAFKSDLLDRMKLVAVGMPFAMEMLAEAIAADAKVSEAPISYSARVGETKLSPIKDGGRIIGVTVRLMFDIRPLLFFGAIGTVLGVIGLILHYLMLPIEFTHIMFPFLIMIGGILLTGVGFVIFLITKFRGYKQT
ncbi:MAG: glycosyltransferase family 2 protein [Candidatus Bathyarchaeia archaeon]